MLSKLNDDGLRSFGKLLSLNVVLATTANVSYFVGASFMHKGPLYGDLPILISISIVVAFWSIGMPLMIYEAAKSAKFDASHAYADQIEQSFAEFIANPEDKTKERYQWLLKNQCVIQEISCWPMSIIQTLIFVCGGNLLLLAVNIWFVFKRTNNLFLLWKLLRID
jgi:hypothetical protein